MLFEAERQAVVALCQQLSQRGFFAATGGNLMLRLDPQQVAVTPSATDYASLSAADVCVLKLSDLSIVDAQRPPSVESSLHARVLRRRPDLHCSIHTHQPLASACALLGDALEVPPTQHALLGKVVPVVGYAPSGTTLLARRLESAVDANRNAWLMRNHGVLCAAKDSNSALAAIEALERLAAAQLNRLISRRLVVDPPANRDALALLLGDLQLEAAL